MMNMEQIAQAANLLESLLVLDVSLSIRNIVFKIKLQLRTSVDKSVL